MTQLQAYLKNSHSSVDIVVEGLVQNESLNIAYKIWVEDSDGRAFVFRGNFISNSVYILIFCRRGKGVTFKKQQFD
jgi:hypothetical protein